MNINLTLQDLIQHMDLNKEFDLNRIKLVRHNDNSIDFKKLINNGLLAQYQAFQGRNIFHGFDYIISFIADGGSRSRCQGIFKIVTKPEKAEWHDIENTHFEIVYKPKLTYSKSKDWINFEEKKTKEYKYDMVEVEEYTSFLKRIVIDWGKGLISWHQKATNIKNIIELYPEGYVSEFPGYSRVFLDFIELEDIIKNINGNKVWHQMLSAVQGIYLITDNLTGNKYIGSTYGVSDKAPSAILGRWKTYVNKGMKENKQLIKLIEDNGDEYKYNFSFTLLSTLSKSARKEDVISEENLWKEKLGTRVMGLNSN